MLVGPDGVGKTTLAQQLVLGLIGLRKRVLGMRVERAERPVLYLALDRPAQAVRSFARMVDESQREDLHERLIVWKGPLPFSIMESPSSLARFVAAQGAGVVVVDSLKDVVPELTKDEVGSRVNMAVQELLAGGIEVCLLHHQRKQQAASGSPKPTKLADVYGSRWLTAGMGSVVLLWGDAGDLIVEFRHLKQPTEEIGPLTLIHDHDHGSTRVEAQVDPFDLVRNAGAAGLTAETVAGVMFTTESPNRNEVEKARRRLERLVTKGLVRREGEKPNTVTYRMPEQR